MSHRIGPARFLARLGKFIASMALMVMRPKDIVEFNRRAYASERRVEAWSVDDFIDQGLFPEETIFLEKVPVTGGRALVLDMGGGREAIALAQKGFEVVGVDFIPEMVEKAQEHAARRGVAITGLVQEIYELEVPPGAFDLAVIFATYSSIPTRKRRVDFLKRVKTSLKSGGYFLCGFLFESPRKPGAAAEALRKAVACLTRGYLEYEKGDTLWGAEFLHVFMSEEDLRQEFAQGGFEVLQLQLSQTFGLAMLRKADA